MSSALCFSIVVPLSTPSNRIPSNLVTDRYDYPLHMSPLIKSWDIQLTPAEKCLRKLILGVCNVLHKTQNVKIETWFVGGWVRDKLIGVASYDVDIALSTSTGKEFAHALKDYFVQHESEFYDCCVDNNIPLEFAGPHFTKRNATKSKHLETAIVTAFGLDVDLVNLREEVYTDDSRTPQIQSTTPDADAYRRDMTINSLFFNLATGEIEDYTSRGLPDLANQVIRTPLDPFKTFIDDPLRVLRVIRFASRLEYRIDTEVFDAMKLPPIHEALGRKVSRERIGIEIVKMANGPKPQMAFNLIHQLQLYEVVFVGTTDPKLTINDNATPEWLFSWPQTLSVLQDLVQDNDVLGSQLIAPNERGETSWLLAAYCPLSRQSRFSVQDFSEALKLTSTHTALLRDASSHLSDIRGKVSIIAEGTQTPRSVLGMAIRSWGSTWKLQVLFALLTEATIGDRSAVLFRYLTFLQYVTDIGVHEACISKPILNGIDVKEIFELKKGGPMMRTILDDVMRWQFDTQPSSKEQAITWLLQRKDNYISRDPLT